MAKHANAGELRTPIIIEKYTETQNDNGYPIKTWVNVFGTGKVYRVKWVNAHGTEVFEAMRLELNEPATLTCRYSPLIDPKKNSGSKYRILYADDASKTAAEKEKLCFEIISIDNVENRNQWMEIKVKRQVSAR